MKTEQNQLIHQALGALVRLGPMDRNEIISLLPTMQLRQISAMETSGFIRIDRGFSDVCHVTSLGRRFIGAAPDRAIAPARTIVSDSDDHYDGAELRPCSLRPGSMDAFDLPSRFQDGLRYRDGRSAT